MSTKLKANLEEAIQKWTNREAEDGDNWPDSTYFGNTVVARMAEAAYAVFMASHEAQDYAASQEPEE